MYILHQVLPMHACFVVSNRLFAFLLLGLFTPALALAQGVEVTGRMVDADTKEPLAGVHVFLASTTHGATTDISGYYSIPSVSPGSYTLVVSMIGYLTLQKSVHIAQGDTSVSFVEALSPRTYQLDGVEVTAEKDGAWERRYHRFREHIIGLSRHAEKTVIQNREVLDFDVDGAGRMIATASEPLVIKNESLGYLITYVMHEFNLDPQAGILSYKGELFFEELEAPSEAVANEWAKKRKAAYLGSLAHLFASIIEGRSFEEGFRLYEGANEQPVGRSEILVSAGEVTHEISIESPLKVVYTRTSPSKKKRRFLQRGIHEEVSHLHVTTSTISIAKDGYYWPSQALTVHGVLAKKRLADLVPRNFMRISEAMQRGSKQMP